MLVCPRREVQRFAELTADETSDLWLTAQKVGKQLESYHKASSLTFAIQVSKLYNYSFVVILNDDIVVYLQKILRNLIC